MEMNGPVIELEGVSKYYTLWESPSARIKAPMLRYLSSLPLTPQKLSFKLRNRAEQLGKPFYALQDLSLHVNRGESLGIIGRNGSGKSTLLQILAGTLNSSSGSSIVNGRIAALLELGSGFDSEFTGRENVFMLGALFGLSPKEIEARFDEVAEFAEIGEFIERPVKTYSSGMMIRLAFATQTLVEPEIFIVDEALSVGDIFFQAKCIRFFRERRKKGMTLLLVSHDLVTIKALCDRTLVLQNGRAKFLGKSSRAVSLYHEINQETLTSASAYKPLTPATSENCICLPDGAKPRNWSGDDEIGTREAEFLYCNVLDAEGETRADFVVGETISIYLYLQAREAVTGMHLGLQIVDRHQRVVYGISSRQIEQVVKDLEPNRIYRCAIWLDGRLGEGEYLVDVALGLGDRGDGAPSHQLHRVGGITAIRIGKPGLQAPFFGAADLRARVAWD